MANGVLNAHPGGPWSPSLELTYTQVRDRLEYLTDQRAQALDVLYGTLLEAGAQCDDIQALIKHADALRRALEPFDTHHER